MAALIIPSVRRVNFSFSFSSYGDRRDLHSFPTRRSSDLGGRSVTSARSRTFTARPSTTAARTPSTKRAPEDRKSTRLNSSHVRISYAVFCLKKKKMNNIQHHEYYLITVVTNNYNHIYNSY